MKKYNKYILEYRKEILNDELKIIIEKYDLNLDDKPIYKGLSVNYINTIKQDNGNIFISWKNDDIRSSRNTFNYINRIINDEPMWSEYDKRSVSCTTNENHAKLYGEVYRLFPIKKDTQINICPTKDLFLSFPINVYVFNNLINFLLNYLDLFQNIDEDKYKSKYGSIFDVKNDLENINISYELFQVETKKKLKELQKHLNENEENYKKFLKHLSNFEEEFIEFSLDKEFDYRNGDLYQQILDKLDPVKNNFNHLPYSEYKDLKGFERNEVWMDCDVIFINNNLL